MLEMSSNTRRVKRDLIFLNAFIEVVDVVIKKCTALESDGQRSESSTRVAPSSLGYICINSIAMYPSALISARSATGVEPTSRNNSWLALLSVSESGGLRIPGVPIMITPSLVIRVFEYFKLPCSSFLKAR